MIPFILPRVHIMHNHEDWTSDSQVHGPMEDTPLWTGTLVPCGGAWILGGM
jgi:hypothetical protein